MSGSLGSFLDDFLLLINKLPIQRRMLICQAWRGTASDRTFAPQRVL